jgi:hypothetical protein
MLVAAEIRMLRKGRGLRAGDLDRRLGPCLRELASAVAVTADVSELRRALAGEFNSHAAQLPADLCVAVTASLGLSTETRHMPHFGDRVSWLAEQSGRNYRTVLRRIDVAEQLLAEEIADELRRRRAHPDTAGDGWYLDELHTVLRLDTELPESHERRRIVATKGGLREVRAWLDVPQDPGQPRLPLQAELVYGGRLIRREESSRSRVEFMIELPAPLAPGEVHEYELILRVPRTGQMRPHYIFTPECQCNSFDLRVRFDPRRPPAWIRLVDGETVRTFEGARSGAEHMFLDAAGEVRVRFSNLAMYLGYGLQWHP